MIAETYPALSREDSGQMAMVAVQYQQRGYLGTISGLFHDLIGLSDLEIDQD